MSFTIERSNNTSGKTYSVEGDVIVFGRSDQSDVLLDDGFVSASHAQIMRVASDFYLQDLNSTNGTFVNSQRINGQVLVRENTVIEFGLGGPKVRLLSLSVDPPGGSERPSVNPPERARAVAAAARPEPALPSRPIDPANPIFQRTAYFAAGCLVLLLCLVASRFLTVPTERSVSAGNTDSADTAAMGDAAAVNNGVTDTAGSSAPVIPEAGQTPVNEEASPADSDEIEINYATVAASVRDQAVWVGVRVQIDDQELVIPYNSGWLVSESRVVTTASTVMGLQALKEDGVIVVYSHLLPEEVGFVEATTLGVHPQFSLTEPTSSTSQSNNLGWIELASPVSLPSGISAGIANTDDWKQSFADEKDCRCIACGYVITSRDAVSPLKMPQYGWTRITATESVSGGASLQTLPMIRIRMPQSQPVSNGQPVINSAGNIVGTLSRVNQETITMIPADRIQQVVASPGSIAK